MTDAAENQSPETGHDDSTVDAIGAVVVVSTLVAMFVFYIWSAGWN